MNSISMFSAVLFLVGVISLLVAFAIYCWAFAVRGQRGVAIHKRGTFFFSVGFVLLGTGMLPVAISFFKEQGNTGKLMPLILTGMSFYALYTGGKNLLPYLRWQNPLKLSFAGASSGGANSAQVNAWVRQHEDLAPTARGYVGDQVRLRQQALERGDTKAAARHEAEILRHVGQGEYLI